MIQETYESKLYRIPGRTYIQDQIEADLRGPIDARTLAPSFEKITDPEWWTGNYYNVEEAADDPCVANYSKRLLLYKGMKVITQDTQTVYVYTGEDTYLLNGSEDSLVSADKWTKLTYANDSDLKWPLNIDGSTLQFGISVSDGYYATYAEKAELDNGGNLYIGKDYVSLGNNLYIDDDAASGASTVSPAKQEKNLLPFYPGVNIADQRGLYVPSGYMQGNSTIEYATTKGQHKGLRDVDDSGITLLCGNGTGVRIKDNDTVMSLSDSFIVADTSVLDVSVGRFRISRDIDNKLAHITIDDGGIDFLAGGTDQRIYIQAVDYVKIISSADVSVYGQTIDLSTNHSTVYIQDDVSIKANKFKVLADSAYVDASNGKMKLSIEPNTVQLGYDVGYTWAGDKLVVNDKEYSILDVSATDVSITAGAGKLILKGDSSVMVAVGTDDNNVRQIHLWGDAETDTSYIGVKSPVWENGATEIPYYKDASVDWMKFPSSGLNLMYVQGGNLQMSSIPNASTGVMYQQGGNMLFAGVTGTSKLALMYDGTTVTWSDQLFGASAGTNAAAFGVYGSTYLAGYGVADANGEMYNGCVYDKDTKTWTPAYLTSTVFGEAHTKVYPENETAYGRRKQYLKIATYTATLTSDVMDEAGNTWQGATFVLAVTGRGNTGIYSVDVRFSTDTGNSLGVDYNDKHYRGFARIRQEVSSRELYTADDMNGPQVIGTIQYTDANDKDVAYNSMKLIEKKSLTNPYTMTFNLYVGFSDANTSWSVLTKSHTYGTLDIAEEKDVKTTSQMYSRSYTGTFFSKFANNQVRNKTGEFAYVQKSMCINFGMLQADDVAGWSGDDDTEYLSYKNFWSKLNPGNGLADIPAPPNEAGDNNTYALTYYPQKTNYDGAVSNDATFGWEALNYETTNIEDTDAGLDEDTKVKLLGTIIESSVPEGVKTTYFSNNVYFDPEANLYATAYFAVSDEREKEQISELNTDTIGFKPKQFNYRKTGRKAYGFIAQDVEKTNPELVSETSDGMKRVDYNSALSLYTAYLERRVADLESRLAAIEEKIK